MAGYFKSGVISEGSDSDDCVGLSGDNCGAVWLERPMCSFDAKNKESFVNIHSMSASVQVMGLFEGYKQVNITRYLIDLKAALFATDKMDIVYLCMWMGGLDS